LALQGFTFSTRGKKRLGASMPAVPFSEKVRGSV
jgi:hypothetical protein